MNRDDADSVEDTEIVVEVVPTTGGSFEIRLDATATVEELRWRVARKVQTPRERLTLLSRERVLKTGRLDELEIRDGSRITLIPQLEAGFSTGQQGTEQSVVQAIESLSEQQVDDFLSGRSPLTLALRVEDHMMFVQLQLEQSERKRRSTKRQSREKADSTDPKIARTQNGTSAPQDPRRPSSSQEKPSTSRLPQQAPPPNAAIPGPSNRNPGLVQPVLSPEEWTRYRAELHRFHQMILPGHQPNCIVYPHQMVSELRSLVAEQQRQSVRHHHQQIHHQMAAAAAAHRAATAAQTAKHRAAQAASSQTPTQSKHNQTASASSSKTPSTIPSASPVSSATATSKNTPTPQQNHSTAPNPKQAYPLIPTQPTRSGKSQQKPRSQSKSTSAPKIESVTNNGPHVFSGTFSGSLHPSVQDESGRPRRDPSTIVQILRDLLSTANHQYLPELLRSQNGVMIGRRAIGHARIRQSVRIGSSSSRHSSSKSSRSSKSSKSSRSSKQQQPPTIDQNYIQWLQKTRRENDITRSKMAKLQEQLKERRNRRRKGVKEDLDGSSSQPLDAETENETTMETLTVGLGSVSPPRDAQSPKQTLNYLSV
ncbi:Oidioi.mRNA.OKI2018_I69.chr1.g1793.t1.cds [Oikopleura dioica]|uniref:Oidioi.mRNA.OKI2018_I69.chr1.g1793.t1.cds n=1 Tax=Oikopleura dioica TaxID=34765 RepID=A0ABN7SP18_OIKDI|nr:Oidioi.mRNA.OKI2018_I69.chr1.g1793.t1.cds [Oikopleura dioica]